MLATYSFDSVNVWQVDFNQFTKSFRLHFKSHIAQTNVLSMLVLPGNKFLVMGTKDGDLLLHDLSQSDFCQTIDSAHKKEIWELAMHTSPQIRNAKGQLLIASASGDRSIKFWNLVQSPASGEVRLQFYEKIEATDEVMGVKFTPDGKYFVFSLLDQTIKVCYLDSMKLSLNLFGHSLPVLSFDISSDSSLLVSCSVDKNIKLWGLDFGDIHKSIFAHQDSITCVQFVKDTHYFMSCSKDRTVKFFDGDTYDEVFVFDNFFAEVWQVAVSSIGDYFVAVGADKCIRIWRQTAEQTFMVEQQDEREDKKLLADIRQEYTQIDVARQSQLDPFAKDKVMKIESKQAVERTAESIKYGEILMDALELADKFREELDQYGIELSISEAKKRRAQKQGEKALKRAMAETVEKPQASIKFLGRNVFEHVLFHLKNVRSAELENTLRFLSQR
mmetsp:Transcript_11147/g.18704  ORF Transcript_11147/g.18704 Transcript_11147/m.18704 type:complete len:445 (-) Transcript_11147:326-1660(-)